MPVEVDVMVQILTINDVNLNDETVDLNIALSMMWTDYRLAWNIEDFNGIKSIEVDPRPSLRHFWTSSYISEPRLGHFPTFCLKTRKSLVWVPDLEIVNRVPSEWIDGRTASKARIFYTDGVHRIGPYVRTIYVHFLFKQLVEPYQEELH